MYNITKKTGEIMDKQKIAEFIKNKRKEQGLTQEELAEKLYVTEKAISRWETGRGTPDISLLLPLSETLKVSVSDILHGKTKSKENITDVINYIELNKQDKFNFPFIISIICYLVSILIFLFYLRLDYASDINLHYVYRLFLVVLAALFIIIGNNIISTNYIDKISDKQKLKKLTNIIIFIYYSVLIFNMAVFARNVEVKSYNLIPFKTIIDILRKGTTYDLTINLLGNFLVFMPIEYFLIELFNLTKPVKNFIISFLIILVCELVQYIFCLGVFDIDDLILCTLGMIVFYFIYNKIKNIVEEKLK